MIPKVAINFAISLDGKTTTHGNSPAQFTSAADKKRFIEIREQADAILVGRKTQETDTMSMTLPDREPSQQPLRCIASKSGDFDFNSNVFCTAGGAIHLIVDSDSSIKIPEHLQEITVTHYCTLKEFVENKASELGIQHLLCEGGGELVKYLFAEELVDIIHLTWAGHSLFGGHQAASITGLPGDFLASSKHYQLSHFEPHFSGECFLTYTRA